MIFIVAIQSFSDIITNSSSEIFICSPKEEEQTAQFVDKILDDIWKADQAKADKLYDRFINDIAGYDWRKFDQALRDNCIDSSSGMGGECTVRIIDRNKVFYYIGRRLDHNNYSKDTKFLLINCDWHRYHSIKWITENLNIIEREY